MYTTNAQIGSVVAQIVLKCVDNESESRLVKYILNNYSEINSYISALSEFGSAQLVNNKFDLINILKKVYNRIELRNEEIRILLSKYEKGEVSDVYGYLAYDNQI